MDPPACVEEQHKQLPGSLASWDRGLALAGEEFQEQSSVLGWGSLRAVARGVLPGMAVNPGGTPSPCAQLQGMGGAAWRVWVMPSVCRLLWSPPSGSVQAQDTAPAWEGPQPPLSPRCPRQGPCVPCSSLQDQDPPSWVRNLLWVRQEPRWARNTSGTALQPWPSQNSF